jgi:glucan phosphoethanolaminetransferase (alkaline phosphatase superfamily)
MENMMVVLLALSIVCGLWYSVPFVFMVLLVVLPVIYVIQHAEYSEYSTPSTRTTVGVLHQLLQSSQCECKTNIRRIFSSDDRYL